jgi:small-conductance mechanosensitive channel
VKKIFQVLTLKTISVSLHRKRQFVLTAVLLVAVLVFQKLNIELITNVPYAVRSIEVVTYALFTYVTINTLRILVVSSHRQRREISNEEHDNFTVGVNAIVNVVTVLATIVFIFIVFEVEMKSFLTSIAIFAVTITLIFQDFIKNFLFGFSIMFSDDYEIGDYIQVGSMPKGVIRNINFSCVQIKTEAGDVLYIPNTLVHSSEIINFSKLKPRRVNVEFRVMRSAATSVAALEKKLLQYLEQIFTGVFEIEKCHVHVKENNKDEILFTLETHTKKASLKLKEQVNHAVQKFAVEYR